MAPARTPSKLNNPYEPYVQEQLQRAVRRIRQVDLLQGALGLTGIVLGYGLVMMVADRWLNLPPLIRQVGFSGLLLGLGFYIWFVLLVPIRRAVNPYYAAVKVEQTIPEAKNSVVNWLDLREEEISPRIRAALGRQAANDLERADLEQAVQGRRSAWLAAGVLALASGLLVCFLLFRGDQFQSLLVRTFQPFGADSPILKQTRITIIEPEGGNATVATHQSMRVIAHLDGRIPGQGRPDSPRVLLRYSSDEPFEALPLEPLPDSREEWGVVLPPNKVRTGLWYKVAAGDDETPEYRVQVRAAPSIVRFELLHIYRPYLRWDSRRSDNPNIEDYRGTRVILDAVTNRQLIEGKLVMETEGRHATISGTVLPDRLDTIRFQFTLEKDAKYRIFFKTADGESNPDSLPYSIRVLNDSAPSVRLTKPEPLAKVEQSSNAEPEIDLILPADGMLRLEGVAQDDFGIQRITLNLRLDGRELKPQPYLNRRSFELETGGYMRSVDYKDDVDLLKLELASGSKVRPKPGQTLEFWLEAEDTCDYPAPQVGRTRVYRARIAAPRVDETRPPKDDAERREELARRQERDNERQQAAAEKHEHETKHEQDRKQQSERDRQERQERQQGGQDDRHHLPEQPGERERDNRNTPAESHADESAKSGEKPTQQKDTGRDDSKGDPTEEKIEKIKQELAREQQPAEPRAESKSDSDPTAGGRGESMKPADSKSQPMNNDSVAGRTGGNSEGNPKSTESSNSPDRRSQSDRQGGTASDATKPEPSDQSPSSQQDGKFGGTPEKPMTKSGASTDSASPLSDAEKPQRPDKAIPQGQGKNEPKDAANSSESHDKALQPANRRQGDPSRPNAPVEKSGTDSNNPSEKKPMAGAEKSHVPANSNATKPTNPDRANERPSNLAERKPPAADQGDDGADGKPTQGQESTKPASRDKKPSGDGAVTDKPMPNDGSAGMNPSSADKKSGGSGSETNDPPARSQINRNTEINRLAEKMRVGDVEARQAAQEQLEKMARSDPNPENRAAAEKALKQAGNPSRGPDENKAEPSATKDQGSRDRRSQAGSRADKPKQAGDSSSPSDAKNPTQPQAASPMTAESSKNERGEGLGKDSSADSKSNPDSRGSTDGRSGQDQSQAGKSDKPNTSAGAENKNEASAKSSDKPSSGSTADQGNTSGAQSSRSEASAGQASPSDQSGMSSSASPSTAQPMDNKSGQGSSTQDSTSQQIPGQAGTNPGHGSELTPRAGGGSSAPALVPKAEDRNEDFARRSGELNLEQVDPKKLRELFQKYNLTEEEYQKWLAGQKEKEGRKPVPAKAGDFQAADRSAGGVNTGVRRVERPQDSGTGKLSAGPMGQAPPEYRKAAERFAEELARPPQPKPK